jgi:hypothetical protein
MSKPRTRIYRFKGRLGKFSHCCTRFPRVIEKFRWVIGLVANPLVRPALRLPFLGYEQGGL